MIGKILKKLVKFELNFMRARTDFPASSHVDFNKILVQLSDMFNYVATSEKCNPSLTLTA